MDYGIIMTRTNKTGTLILRKEYSCPIPLHIIEQLINLEKQEWQIFNNAPYYDLGKFIYTHLSDYPLLTPYIHKNTPPFDFTYQYIIDQSELVHTSYTYSNVEISPSHYMALMHHEYYLEHWFIFHPSSYKAFMFFECDYTPSASS